MSARKKKIESLYAEPCQPRFEDCDFYHSMDIPGYGPVTGQWDLRPNVAAYLGNTDFNGKRVLEIGPASGYLTNYMENQGADVVALDLPTDYGWDIVPRPQPKVEWMAERKRHMKRLHNSFWYLHSASKSKAKVIYGKVIDLPDEVGMFDVSIMTGILLHARDPIGIICRCGELTNKRILITESIWGGQAQLNEQQPTMTLIPSPQNASLDLWFLLSPKLIIQLLQVIGFQNISIYTHNQLYVQGGGNLVPHYTIVGERA
ncbi:class I SAM-dependent methyltransferase [Polynucleobacter sp. HIN6]|uniref:class I SAM-dependent methyltransferase n=1 Tax=Polynucleobacter sp. HIN6 TaxID=3047865 RepID=UPI002572E2BF|nr:methyltransferase domain-containing protein [Polynucleobacter sp. HIN6]